MTPPEGLTGRASVHKPLCSGNLFIQHVMFHISSSLLMPTLHAFQLTVDISKFQEILELNLPQNSKSSLIMYITEYETRWQISQEKITEVSKVVACSFFSFFFALF